MRLEKVLKLQLKPRPIFAAVMEPRFFELGRRRSALKVMIARCPQGIAPYQAAFGCVG
jgi:hypothetical protein